jgi:hypothetical protein
MSIKANNPRNRQAITTYGPDGTKVPVLDSDGRAKYVDAPGYNSRRVVIKSSDDLSGFPATMSAAVVRAMLATLNGRAELDPAIGDDEELRCVVSERKSADMPWVATITTDDNRPKNIAASDLLAQALQAVK